MKLVFVGVTCFLVGLVIGLVAGIDIGVSKAKYVETTQP